METYFKYKDKILSTPNLEKKLKRMKLSLSDIEIIPPPEKKEIQNELEFPHLEQIKVKSTKDNIIRVVSVYKGTRPPLIEIFKNHIWNPETKTGIKNLTEELIDTFYYDE